MNYKILQLLSKPLLNRNEQFKGRHAGEVCYIVGAGASIKSMSLEAFSDHVSIGLNGLCIHNEYPLLNVLYHVIPEPRLFYPYRTIYYTKKFQRHYVGGLLKRAISQYPDVALFTSLSNLFGPGVKNETYYLHHFGNRQVDIKQCNISGAFSFMAGGFYAGIGLAISMGFKKAYLVGCDYLFSPKQDGHFYSYGPPRLSSLRGNPYENLFKEVLGLIDLVLVTDGAESEWLPFVKYEEFTGRKLMYRENTELVREEYLRVFNKAANLGQFPAVIMRSS